MAISRKRPLPIVIIDTREQQPYEFDPARVVSVRRGLPVGDYSLQGYESAVAVERKSLDDFVGTVIRARGRFERELDCLREFDLGCVVVEATHEDVLQRRYRAQVHPNAVLGAAVAITVDHHVPVFFCTNRQFACGFVERLLLRFHEKHFPQFPQAA